MPRLLRYLTHPQVEINPAIPVPDWGLNAVGRARVEALVASGALAATTRIVSSAERKAIETAQPIADPLGLSVDVRARMHENDRSATGFLPPPEFETVADAFFANPQASIRGWERAIDAQARIVAEAEAVLAIPDDGDILIVGHGAVGTLLYCHLAGMPISRHDQPGGGGHYFAMDLPSRRVLHGWRRMEEMA